MKKLEELKAAYEAVIADGDLKVDHWDNDAGATLYFGVPDRDGDLPYDQMLLEQDNDNVFAPANDLMNFIALAHNMMPTLLEAVERYELLVSVLYSHGMDHPVTHKAEDMLRITLEKLK